MFSRCLFLCSIFFVLFSHSGNAQDLIVKLNGDSLHVKIDDTNDRFIYFFSPETKKGKRLVISRKEVFSILYNYEAADPRTSQALAAREYEVIQLYGMAMGSRLLQYEPLSFGDDFDEYHNALRWGISGLTAGVNYFINKEYGFGLLYSQNSYENSLGVVDTARGIIGTLTDQITLNYYAANLAYRLSGNQSRTVVQVNVGIGYCTFQNAASAIHSYEVKGGSLGIHLTGMANFSLGYGFYIPVQLGLKGFNISQLSVTFPDGTPDYFRVPMSQQIEAISFNVARLELSVGLMFAF